MNYENSADKPQQAPGMPTQPDICITLLHGRCVYTITMTPSSFLPCSGSLPAYTA